MQRLPAPPIARMKLSNDCDIGSPRIGRAPRSGAGLENIYQAIVQLDGLGIDPKTAIDITRCALSGDCQVAREALTTFCALLGSFAVNVALTFGARGGVYIAAAFHRVSLTFVSIGFP
jgi:glucokinase